MVMVGVLSTPICLDSVRQIANSNEWREVCFHDKSKVLSFARHDEQENDRVRIHVYYTTGTVATSLDHPRLGRNQLFQRNVNLQQLEEIFRNPKLHTGKGVHRRVPANEQVVPDELCAARAQLQRLMVDQTLIQQQVKELQTAIQAIEKESRRNEEEEQREKERLEKERLATIATEKAQAERLALESERYQRGNQIDCFIKQGDSIEKHFSDKVASLSCADGTTIMLYEDGGWACTGGLTKLLHSRLQGRPKTLPKPTYVAIGSMDRYYIRFADGSGEYATCELMRGVLKRNANKGIASIAFGERWDSYAIVFRDGSYSYYDIPEALNDLLIIDRQGRTDLSCISLGPTGEYFVAAKNGETWWGGIGTSATEQLEKYRDRIKFIDFSTHDEYVMRYS